MEKDFDLHLYKSWKEGYQLKSQILGQLEESIFETIEELKVDDVGIAFSGGVDSSLLSKVCKELNKKATLLTVSFSNNRDIIISNQVSRELDLPILQETVSLEELETGLKDVLQIINFKRIARLDICTCFYYVFKLASENGLHTILSANGMDELFCGYEVYRTQFSTNKYQMDGLMKNLIETAKYDNKEIDKIASLFKIEYLCPFLFDKFVDFSLKIPIQYKITSEKDCLRKRILRDVAYKIGVPISTAYRPKKAFQYSSGSHKAIRKLASKRGFTKTMGRKNGFKSGMEAYINNLKNQITVSPTKV